MFSYFKRRNTLKFTKEKGAAAVEFAIILPWLVMIVFMILECGIAYNNYIALTHAAREGARLAVVGEYVEKRVRDSAPSVQIATITVDSPSPVVVGGTVTVTVTGTVLPIDIPLVYSGGITLSSNATLRMETNHISPQ